MPRVLVVDDDEALREAIAEAIEGAGYVVEQARNGREAIDKMRVTSPSFVLLDLMMPVMDGWEVVAEMDADPVLAAIPVCVVSAQDRVAPPRSVRTLKKPVSVAALIKAIEDHCGKPVPA